MAEKNKVQALIDGISFTIVGEEDERYIHFIASYIDKSISEYKKKNRDLSKHECILLLALNLKDELEKEKVKFEELETSIINSQNLEKLNKYDQVMKELSDLKESLYEREETIEKYKKSEEYSTNRLREETLKLRDAYYKINNLKETEENARKDYSDLEKKLQDQERKTLDKEMEVIRLKNQVRTLKEELTKFEK